MTATTPPAEPSAELLARAEQAEAGVERLRAELVEVRRVITALPDPGTVEELREKIAELFGNSDEALVHTFLNYAWSETARIAGWEMVARWQAEAERNTLKAAIEQFRQRHTPHDCHRDHNFARTPVPCVNADMCRCGSPLPCRELVAWNAALAAP